MKHEGDNRIKSTKIPAKMIICLQYSVRKCQGLLQLCVSLKEKKQKRKLEEIDNSHTMCIV